MNPISFVSWFWKAVRGQSVTFAVLLACGLLGISAVRWIKTGLDAAGAPWLAVFLGPTVLIAVLAKKESAWIPDENQRKWWARGIVIGAAALTGLISWLKTTTPAVGGSAPTSIHSAPDAHPEEVSPPSTPASKPPASVRPRGPSGK